MATMEQQVESIVDTILEDYRNGRSIDRMNPFAHPDKEVVIDMIGKLMRIVYPGFSRDKNYRIYNTHHNLSMLIEDVMYNMVKQLTMVFRADMEEQQAQEKAQQVSLDFFRAIPALRDVIRRMWRPSTTETPPPTAPMRSSIATPAFSPLRFIAWPMCSMPWGCPCCRES